MTTRSRLAVDGVVVFDHPLVTPARLADLRTRFDALFDGGTVPPWLRKTIADPGHPEHPVDEINFPSAAMAVLVARPEPLRTLRSIAGDLLGAPARLVFDHAIRRPGGCPTRTPWHQDSVYFDGDDAQRARDAGERVHLWMPLVDTDPESGGMRYLRGSHRMHLPHRMRGEHLVVDGDTPPGPLVQPTVPAGGCAAHHPMTVHGANGTTANDDRVAWITHFAIDRRPAPVRRAIEARELAERRARVLAWRARRR